MQFLAELGEAVILAEVRIARTPGGWELRQIRDADAEPGQLRLVTSRQVRALSQTTANGEFRPLKSAPTLVAGWRLPVVDAADLEFALNQFYPGAIADWFAARQVPVPVTHFREYAGRQSGMYRITSMLSDEQSGGVIQSSCDRGHCLKCRLWTVPGLALDSVGQKSLIPCLEPCAILLELARKAMRTIQEQERAAVESGSRPLSV